MSGQVFMLLWILLVEAAIVTLAQNDTTPQPLPITSPRDGLYEIHLGGLLPRSLIFGKRLESSALFALQEVNDRQDVLPGYKLVLNIKDTMPLTPMPGKVNPMGPEAVRQTTMKTLEFIAGNPVVHMVYGDLFTSTTEASAFLTSLWNIVQVTPLANAVQLSDKTRYPFLASLVAEDTLLNDLTTYFIQKYGWTKVAVITDTSFDALAKNLEDRLKTLNVTVDSTYLVSDADDPDSVMKSLKDNGIRIIVIQVYQKMHFKLLCSAFHKKMYAPTYLWLANNLLVDDLEMYYNDPDHRDPGEVNCTWEEILIAAEGQFGTTGYSYLEQKNDTITIGGKTVAEVHRRTAVPGDTNTAGWNLYGYDSMWSMALALNNSIPRIYPKQLENFSYQDKFYTDMFMEELEKLYFIGATGPVSFTDKGMRVEKLRLLQLKEGAAVTVGWYDRTVDTFDQQLTETEIWKPYGYVAPRDSPDFSYEFINVSPALFAVYTVLALVSTLVALTSLALFIVYRDQSAITLGWPLIRSLVACGIIMLNIAVILMGVNDTVATPEIFEKSCQAGAWLLVLGFTFGCGGMLSNSIAMYHYHTKDVTKTVIQELKYCAVLLPMLFVDLLLLILWQAIDPLKVATKYLPMEPIEERDAVYQPVIHMCACRSITAWRIVFLVFKGILLLTAAFITWPAWMAAYGRGSVTGHYLGICIYVAVLAAIVGIPVTFTVEDSPDVSYGVAGGFILLCTLTTGATILASTLFAKRHPTPGDTTSLVSPINSLLRSISEGKIKNMENRNKPEMNGNDRTEDEQTSENYV